MLLDRWPAEVLAVIANFVGDDGYRVGTLVSTKTGDLRKW